MIAAVAVCLLVTEFTTDYTSAPLPDAADIRPLLNGYYEQNGRPLWHAVRVGAIRLGAGDEAAATFLVGVLDQAAKDETSGTAPWQATPFWSAGGENPARNLRRYPAQWLASSNPAVASLPLLRWYLEYDPYPPHQLLAAQALAKLPGPDAAKVRAAVLTSSNLALVTDLIKQIAGHGERLTPEQLAPLCQHLRLSVRDSARALNRKLGYPEPPPFDPIAAVKSKPIADLMAEVGKLWLDPPPADAQFVVATEQTTLRTPPESVVSRGWLLADDGDEVRVYTEFGRVRVMKRSGRDEGNGLKLTGLDPLTLAGEAERIERVRADGDRSYEFSERGGFRGQFRGTGASVPETLIAYRLYSTGQFELAARVLFPALDTLHRDADLIDRFRYEMGIVAGHRMLVAFAGDRDYSVALKHAEAIAKHYPDTLLHRYALRLVEELPRRRDDFAAFALPTLDEWERFCKTSTREQQIDYLCERLRLLNGFQDGQPGGADLHAAQYAEPCGISDDAAWGLRRGRSKLVNPLNALVGAKPYNRRNEWAPAGLRPTAADIPTLSKHLRQDWLMPSVSFHRDFNPPRTVHSTREQIGGIINRTAGFDLCELRRWDKLTPTEVDREIERIDRWAKEHADREPPPPDAQPADPKEELLGKGPGHGAGQRTAPSAWWFVAIGVPTLVLILLIRRRMGANANR
jgi:hypothetical protein